MQEQVILGMLAIAIGAVVGVVLFVPFVAVSYRRRGGLSVGRFLLWFAALVYFWAIWTYTLLPLPDPAGMRCAGVNLDLFAFIGDIRGAIGRPGRTLTDPAVLQLLLNVLLFVPLGFFLRVLGGRGILVALVVGLALSAFIETTQLAGVWGLYPCAYRVFDVDDMLTNTTGAVLGSVLSLLVPRHLRGSRPDARADEPRAVTRGRRFLAMVCDLLAIVLVQGAVGIAVQVWLEYVVQDRAAVLAGTAASVIGPVLAAGAWLVVVLVRGRSVGDATVRLRYTGGPLPVWLARILRFAGGAGGWVLLGMLPGLWNVSAGVFFVVAAVMLFTTERGRGLPGVLSRQRLRDEREPAAPVRA